MERLNKSRSPFAKLRTFDRPNHFDGPGWLGLVLIPFLVSWLSHEQNQGSTSYSEVRLKPLYLGEFDRGAPKSQKLRQNQSR